MKEHKVAIRFQNVYFSYNDVKVLEDVSFHIHEGEFVTIVGPNGTGKTTILKLILGLIRPQKGKIEVFGGTPEESLYIVGYIPQNIDVDINFPISVEKVVKMGLLNGFNKNLAKKEEVETILKLTDTIDLRDRIYGTLSGGEKRRVLIARALISKPKLLLLDEPTANIDLRSENKLFSILEELKKSTTILIVTHDTGFVSEITDVVLCVSKNGEKHNLLRHAVEITKEAPQDIYGGKVLRILHNTDLPDDINCLNLK